MKSDYDYYQFYDLIASGLKYFGGQTCLNNVGAALKDLHNLVRSQEQNDKDRFMTLFKASAELKNDMDRGEVEEWVAGTIALMAIWNEFYDPNGLQSICDEFKDVPANKRLETLSAIYLRENGCEDPECEIGYDYQVDWVEYLKDDTYSDDTERLWKYQECMGYFSGGSTASSKSIFNALQYHTIEHALVDVCKQVYDITYVPEIATKINNKYGGFNINVASGLLRRAN
jgi:hypothetical protein